jgi:hypothetical protein
MPAVRRRVIRNRAGRLLAERDRIFLPDHLEQVRAIAMRGISEEEMSEIFDISEKEITRWKKQYPLFKRALDEGYTDADQAVLSALYQSAVGYSHEEEKVFQWDGEIIRADTVRHYKPDLPSIKLWITNRQREHWKDRQQVGVSGGSNDNAPIGLRDESKLELMASILALIQPKPDRLTIDGRTGQVEP